MEIINTISKEMSLNSSKVAAVMQLLNQGASLPFIARYRKEMTGSMDEILIANIRDRMEQLDALIQRKNTILKSLKDRELLNKSLLLNINKAKSMVVLEDIYEKFRIKKHTKAQIAREKGLEPLANFLFDQTEISPHGEAEKYISIDKNVETIKDALSGARDIIAAIINEDINIRSDIRNLFVHKALIRSKLKKTKKNQAIKFQNYFDWSEPAQKAPSHRVLAMFRGQNKGFLQIHVLPDQESALKIIQDKYIKNNSKSAIELKSAILDAYKRLLSKSIEKEYMAELKKKADNTAIKVFGKNLRDLLLFSPLGQKRTLAIDPGFRTGCKFVCLDAQGQLLHHDLIFPFRKDNQEAARIIVDIVRDYNIKAIAIGNGTAGRETLKFIEKLKLDNSIHIVMVDESGASIYSASKLAREEFPDHDITIRGAVSIGRRLMDPLAELVKLDPKSIGVGQYQYDVDQKLLKKALDDVVMSCVNTVGVEVNTASKELLCQVCGINSSIALNIVNFRNEHGPFQSKKEFLKVPRLGPKAFEQAAGFLRINNGKNPLDKTGIHPESYELIEQIAKDAGMDIKSLIKDKSMIHRINLNHYISESIGIPTLTDIMNELSNPGRDPRENFKNFSFDKSIHEINDLIPGMKLKGIVTNVTAFGAFVDIGVHQDGLVHISQMADRFIKDPSKIVKVRQNINVTILEVDIERKRISLSMKDVLNKA